MQMHENHRHRLFPGKRYWADQVEAGKPTEPVGGRCAGGKPAGESGVAARGLRNQRLTTLAPRGFGA